MKKTLKSLLVLTLLITFGNALLAQEPKQPAQQQKKEKITKPALLEKKSDKKEATGTIGQCACLEAKDFSASKLLEQAYNAVQEDEWDKAIDTCKQVFNTLKANEKKCACGTSQLLNYEKIVQSFQKYAEGGRDLDNSDKPNCEKVLKLYNEAISTLKDETPKADVNSRKLAEEIKNYALEEKEFAEDECKGI